MTNLLDVGLVAVAATGLARTALFVGAAIAHATRGPVGGAQSRVSVLIPAKDEADVIEDTVRSVLAAAAWADVAEIVVIDDGSTDGTSDMVRKIGDPRVHLLTNAVNRGKAHALNDGLAATTAPIVVTLDADTRLAEDALVRISTPFKDPAVAAVAGNVKVANREGWLGALQSVEYVGALNIDRRGQATLGCITTVPGALGAWRRDALPHGFSSRTLAEDTDATLSVGMAGGKIHYAADAVAFTVTPHTPVGLYRQRLRWLHGNLQCLGRHLFSWPGRSASFAVIGLPDFAWRHVGAFLAVPLSAAWLPQGLAWVGAPTLLVASSLLFVADLLVVVLAYRLDGERVPAGALVAQRLLWPFLAWAVLLGVLVRFATGARGWTRARS